MPDSEQEPWFSIWPSRDGSIWHALTSAEFKQFPLKQLAEHWAKGEGATA